MGRNSKIIELYGLPASGKTTLMKKIIDENDVDIITLDDFKKYLKKHKLKMLTCICYSNIINHMVNIFSVKSTLRFKIKNLKSIIKIEIAYNYFRKYGDKDYLISDHGLIQQFISNMNGYELKSKNFSCIQKILDKCHIDYAIMTKIDIETAQSRMIGRNRNEGRLDIEKNKEKQLEMFQKEKINFDALNNFLKSNFVDINQKDLNTQSIESLHIGNMIK